MKNHSVLNTDLFDRRRFGELFDMSEKLQQIEHEAVLPLMEALLCDVWACLYKMKPEIRTDDTHAALQMHRMLLRNIIEHESYSEFHCITRLNDLAAIVGTIKIGELINKYFVAQLEQRLDLCPLLHVVKSTQDDFIKSVEEVSGLGLSDGIEFEQSIMDYEENFIENLTEVMLETKQIYVNVKSLLGGLRAGKGDADLTKVPLRDQITLAEKLAADKQLRDIAEWAGRFKQIARKKQKNQQSESVERRGIAIGSNLELLLPYELGLLTHPISKVDFLRRFIEVQTMQYNQLGQEVLGKGPIILCLDQSSSMSSFDSQSKGFALALMTLARKQHRDFCLLTFSKQTKVFTYAKGKIKTSEMLMLARTYLNGGTDFTIALQEALEIIKLSRFKKADIIFITDGEDEVDEQFLTLFNKKKSESSFQVLSLILTDESKTVEAFSDRVIKIVDFEDDGSFTAFEV
ncbi:VWA domain-containing protein [Sporosarcina oncorhynchi]|uniref:VWA domain-containing protein n=1 Tax=Sporosarcina oncorhynchi TaxID=3056444 RepID=A0ABZ0L317_9BACL|nr:VWA domain-containing protein [Sporosarcina sp. T2O-4]WOV86293.1 VWA domain-containing protein [Sporosarcina sp. T2O-4]